MALVDIRKDERKLVFAALLAFFGIICAHTMSETARDALFLIHLPASYLPMAYLAIGITSFAVGRLSTTLTKRFGQRGSLIGIIALGAIMALVFRGAFSTERRWLFYAYYVWVGTFATTSVVEFWLFASTIFTVSQGKRLFGLVGAGASLGTFAGAGVAWLWARRLPIESLLWVVAGMLFLTALVPLLLPASPRPLPKADQPAASTESFWKLLREPYLLRVAALVSLASLTLMLVDYQFKAAAAAAVSHEALPAFLGAVNGALGATALIFQALSGRIVKRFGIGLALGLMPALLLAGGLALPMMSALGRALALRSTDGTLRHSLHRVGMELLYMPLSSQTRARIKAFLDGSVSRFSQATASVLLLGMAAAKLTDPLLGICIVVFSGAWLVLAWTVRRPYLQRFLSMFEADDEPAAHFPDLEVASLGVLVEALSSPNARVVVSALEILAAQGEQARIPRSILNYRSPEVLVKALEVLGDSKRTDFASSLPGLLRDERPEVRAAALRTRIALGASDDELRPFLSDPSAIIRGIVSVRICDHHKIHEMAAGPPALQAALLSATRDPELVRRLAKSVDPTVVRAASRAIVRIDDAALLPLLLPWLAIGTVRREVRAALAHFGGRAFDVVAQALEDPVTEMATRRHLPRSLLHIDSVRAAPILVRNLHRDRQLDGVVRYKILLALAWLVVERPELPLDRQAITSFTVVTAERLHRYYVWAVLLRRAHAEQPSRATDTGMLLGAILKDKLELGTQRLFRLLSLLYPKGKLIDLHGALSKGEPSARAAALEILENLLSPELRTWVVPLCDDLSDERRFVELGERIQPLPSSYAEVLEAISTADDALAELTAYHASELPDEPDVARACAS